MNPRRGGRGPVVLVTGANSGIGRATVRSLLDRGAHVVASVRSDEAAAEVRGLARGDQLVIERLDVTDVTACRRVVDLHRPDVVVNNAGTALLGAIVDVDDGEARAQLDALVVAPVRLARLAQGHMASRGGGRIINVSSVLGQANVPFTGWYSAAKAALDSLTDTLRIEFGPSGVQVVSIECGAVATDVWSGAGSEVVGGDDPTTEGARRRWLELTEAAQDHFADPEEVGAVIASAATDTRVRRVYRVGFGSRLGVLSNVVPRTIQDAVTRVVFRLDR